MENVIYCLSGLGADERVFGGIHINGFHLKHLPWLKPFEKENIKHYSLRMAEMIDHPFPILLGVSFGGLIAIEMAKEMTVNKIIIVSSVKSDDELPNWMKLVGRFQLNKIFPVKSNKFTERFDDHQLGIANEEEKIMVESYRKKSDPSYMDWAINEILNWKNRWQPKQLFHIHGSMDRMFPIKNIKPTHVIDGGTHIMMINRHQEISTHINDIISQV